MNEENRSGMTRDARVRARSARVRGLAALALAVAAFTAAPVAAQDDEGFSWRSYAELGAGGSLAGQVMGFAATELGFYVGNFEFGSYVQLLPLEFGSVELIEAAAAAYGGSVGYAFGQADAPRAFVKLGLGGVARERADENGGFDGIGAERGFAASAAAGAELPLGGRWKARLWAGYRLVPDLKDYDGNSLSGFDLGASIRIDWRTTIR